MKRISTILTLGILLGLTHVSTAQSKAIYTNPEFEKLASHHRVIAILPFDVSIQMRPYEMEKITEEQLANMRKQESEGLQHALQAYFLKKKARYDYRVDFQDPRKTNALLERSGLDPQDLSALTHEELAQILEVDAIIAGKLLTTKPLSEGASAALGIAFGIWGPTNKGSITISLNNGVDGELLWKYDKTLARSLGSDYNTIVDAMMRKASRKFPYRKL